MSMCEACERGDHANCGLQTWCECDCDPEAAALFDMQESKAGRAGHAGKTLPIESKGGTAGTPAGDASETGLTLFLCGPSKCEHDYQGMEEVRDSGESRGWTAVCTKCGARAIDEAAWS